MYRLLLAVFVIMTLSGCNTMQQKTFQKITVSTPGIEYADCVLETEANKYRLLSPDTIDVERSRYPMTITCQKINYLTAARTLEAKVNINGIKYNVFNGFIPGTAYDIASNSIYEYPDNVIIEMTPDPHAVAMPAENKYELQKKEEPVRPKPLAGKGEADKSFSKSLRK